MLFFFLLSSTLKPVCSTSHHTTYSVPQVLAVGRGQGVWQWRVNLGQGGLRRVRGVQVPAGVLKHTL